MDQNEGSFADSKGAIKKRWRWWDHTTHVHAPPFQPICFALNSVLSVRCLAQDQIYLAFSQNKMNLRFNVGVKLKVRMDCSSQLEIGLFLWRKRCRLGKGGGRAGSKEGLGERSVLV